VSRCSHLVKAACCSQRLAPRALLARVIAHRLHVDIQGDRVLEYALAELIEEGEVQRHVRRVRREYVSRRDVLMDELRRQLGQTVRFDVPAGGIALWVEAIGDTDVDAWAKRARDRGAVIVTAREPAEDRRPRPFTRLGFASLSRDELAEGVRRLASARLA
jgi:GntR family transcriptional regulator / MocR family aminotransferase